MRMGIDLGGTKVEAVILDDDGSIIWRQRQPTPRHDYDAIISTIGGLITAARRIPAFPALSAWAFPAVCTPKQDWCAGANTQVLNSRDLKTDCETATSRQFLIENDANCFALSEAVNGAAEGYDTVFGVIMGTGCGGGFVANGRVLSGANNLAGEWGHTPLPWPVESEYDGHECWCGLTGCLETFISGTAVAADYASRTGVEKKVEDIAATSSTDLVAESVLAGA